MADNDNGSMEASGYGIKARLDNVDTKTLLLAALVIICLVVVGWQWSQDRKTDVESKQEYLSNHKTTQTLLSTVITNQKAIIDLINESRREARADTNEITYVLTRTQAQREALNLEMPASLRQKVIERRR